MTIYLIIGLVMILLCALVFILSIIIKDNMKRIKELKNDNKILSDNVMSLVRYSDLIAKLRNEKEEVNNELLQAETPEEIMSIIDRLIQSNNNRVRK
jgi:biopolymer transport protein ExbB/TolQ